MEEKNELNDIILNKGASTSSSKKLVLAVATLGVILIIVVMLMNTISSNGTDNLPQAVLPPQPQEVQAIQEVESEPLFEEVEVIQEIQQNNDSLDKIAQKLKEESRREKIQAVVPTPKKVAKRRPKPKIQTKKVLKQQVNNPVTPVSQMPGSYYIQVGSFAKYKPNKKFLDSVLTLGYKYKFHKVERNGKTLNKVLVGPFPSEGEARGALRSVRSNIEAGAFLIKI